MIAESLSSKKKQCFKITLDFGTSKTSFMSHILLPVENVFIKKKWRAFHIHFMFPIFRKEKQRMMLWLMGP